MGAKENELNADVMLQASAMGHRLWRNNGGVAFNKDGSVVAYGVATPGGSDLIGFTQVTITPDMVGSTVAVFTAVECKTGKLRPSEPQRQFLAMVEAKGGIATWGTDAGRLIHTIATWKPSER